MADSPESSSGKKRRIIHWNPDAGREQATRRWTWRRIAGWSVGGFFALLVVAGIINRLPKLVGGQTISDMIVSHGAAPAPTGADASATFVTQAKAEQAHEMVSKSLLEIRRMPQDHPVQLDQMIFIEKSFREAEALLEGHEWAAAYAAFDSVGRDIDAYGKNAKAKGEAKAAYDTVLVRVKDLELARSLAPGALENALAVAGTGRKLLEDGNFTGAKQIFDGALAELKKAEQALTTYVRENLVNGQKALTKGEKEEAKKAFQAALEKAPGNEDAIRGLKRAENIDRVYALLQQGQDLEKQAKYADAAESYQKAFALDNMSALAQEGAARAARLEKETKFAAAQSAADAAAARHDWTKAIAEYESALKVYPQKTEVQAALKSAKESAHKDAVQKALDKGYAYENQHQWKEARDAYSETLQLEPNQPDAREGYIRAGNVIRALLEYERLIDAAEQLANKAEFQAAYRRFNDAMNSKPTYLEASDRVLQLRALLVQQTQAVEVTFKSDGKTWVSVGAYRAPSQFETATFKIFPGDYQVKGSRRGYRDVNLTLQVRNGTPPPPVVVECTESFRG
jgi:tetratricopeptide (TPR) repeat protein